jgi:hypothetical protein
MGKKVAQILLSITMHRLAGSKVTPHQDATFLYNKPGSLYGFWFACDNVILRHVLFSIAMQFFGRK